MDAAIAHAVPRPLRSSRPKHVQDGHAMRRVRRRPDGAPLTARRVAWRRRDQVAPQLGGAVRKLGSSVHSKAAQGIQRRSSGRDSAIRRIAPMAASISSSRTRFARRKPQRSHSCTSFHRPPVRNTSTGPISPPHGDARSPGCTSTCLLQRHFLQWLVYPSPVLAVPQRSQTKSSTVRRKRGDRTSVTAGPRPSSPAGPRSPHGPRHTPAPHSAAAGSGRRWPSP